MNIVPTPKAVVDDKLVSILEDLLNSAKNGQIVGLVGAVTYIGRSSANFMLPGKPVILLGELRILERELIDKAIQLTHHQPGEDY